MVAFFLLHNIAYGASQEEDIKKSDAKFLLFKQWLPLASKKLDHIKKLLQDQTEFISPKEFETIEKKLARVVTELSEIEQSQPTHQSNCDIPPSNPIELSLPNNPGEVERFTKELSNVLENTIWSELAHFAEQQYTYSLRIEAYEAQAKENAQSIDEIVLNGNRSYQAAVFMKQPDGQLESNMPKPATLVNNKDALNKVISLALYTLHLLKDLSDLVINRPNIALCVSEVTNYVLKNQYDILNALRRYSDEIYFNDWKEVLSEEDTIDQNRPSTTQSNDSIRKKSSDKDTTTQRTNTRKPPNAFDRFIDFLAPKKT